MISTLQKLAIGAIGAICLGLLKLINANFYLGAATSQVAVGAYLTYCAYLVLGMAVGALFCEQFPDDVNKTRKSAFLMGLLAPSILIAIITKPIGGEEAEKPKSGNIPTLGIGSFFAASAYAQSPTPEQSTAPAVTVVTKADVVPGLADGVKNALGAQRTTTDSVFVVGKSKNEAEAVKTASDINALLTKSEDKDLKAQLIRPQGQENIFVTVGAVTSAKTASETENKVKEAAIKTLAQPEPAAKEAATAKTLLRGDVYKSEALFPK